MKKILMNIAVLSMVGLVGCSSNTQRENTTVGAVTGAVVGGVAGTFVGNGAGRYVAVAAGAVIGALIGGSIGNSMQSSDNTTTYTVVQSNPTNQTTAWVNPKTGYSYTMTPTSDFFTVNGNPKCRNYHFTVKKIHKVRAYDGTACFNADGTWYTVR